MGKCLRCLLFLVLFLLRHKLPLGSMLQHPLTIPTGSWASLFSHSWVTKLSNRLSLPRIYPTLCHKTNLPKNQLGHFAQVTFCSNCHDWLSGSFPLPCHLTPQSQIMFPAVSSTMPPTQSKSSHWATGLLSWTEHTNFPLSLYLCRLVFPHKCPSVSLPPSTLSLAANKDCGALWMWEKQSQAHSALGWRSVCWSI